MNALPQPVSQSPGRHDAFRADGETVFLWDPDRSRRCHVNQLIRAVAPDAVVLERDGSKCLLERPSHGSIALVALNGSVANDEPALEWIAQRKAEGCAVISYGDGVTQWPLRLKCRPLLSGAIGVFDSAVAGFSEDLRRCLSEHLRNQAETLSQIHETRRLMAEHGIVGESRLMVDVFGSAMRFSRLSDLPVLITGESGTGKELLAKAIAKMDPKRKDGPFLSVNCAAVQPALVESEFFGYRRGAFTGAERNRSGWVRASDGGVLFLDEIGELNLDLQAKLLRVLQENRVLAVGEDQDVAVNVRFMAATNRNLDRLVADGRFRADLLHRLRVLVVELPPLRERPSDIPHLVEHFAEKYCADELVSRPALSGDFIEALGELELFGNVRQLENIVRQSLIGRHHPPQLELADLPADVLRQLTGPVQAAEVPHRRAEPVRTQPCAGFAPERTQDWVRKILDEQGWNFHDTLQNCERAIFQAALRRTSGNQSAAARLLGISSRTVYSKVQKHRLSG